MRAMALMKKHTFLLIMGLIMRRTRPISSDTFQDDQLFDLTTEDDRQITSCDFESLCLWTLSHNLTHTDWSVVSPQLLQGEKIGKIPSTDHSVGTSDGNFLLLSTTSAAGPTGRCQYHLTSPVLPGSNRQCILQVALYDTRPIQGNLTILIKPIMSDLPNHSVTFSHRRRDDRRPEWQVFEAVIGQVNEPFQVTLLYTSCVAEDSTLALDSLDFIHCESGDYLDILAISCDSFNEETNQLIGRTQGRKSHLDSLYKIRSWCQQYKVAFKINSVINTFNIDEDMTEQIRQLDPVRWKVFQCLLIDGENAGETALREAERFVISDQQFQEFLCRHSGVSCLVPESNEKMRNSYLILDEYMRFLDCREGSKHPSRSILDVGVKEAICFSGFDEKMFFQRGGKYVWSKADMKLEW